MFSDLRFAVGGIDEAGRGPLAGPVTAACVVLPPCYHNDRIGDSKQLSHKLREELYPEIVQSAVAWSVVSVGPRRIESLNIRQATALAMRLAAERVFVKLAAKCPKLTRRDLHLLIDGNMLLETDLSQDAIVKGDSRVLAIAAASILAKVTRDRLMLTLDLHYPGYGFAGHKGYPTKPHIEKVAELGVSMAHRRTFSGVREYLPSDLTTSAS